MIGFEEALAATLAAIEPLQGEEMAPIAGLTGRVVAMDLLAPEDSPAIDISLKDGFAVQSADVVGAAPDRPVRLRLVGQVAAGGVFTGEVSPGETVRILSGAPLPAGADAILAEEFADCEGELVIARADAAPGRNILPRAADLARGQLLIPAGAVLRPAQVGLLAAAGYREAPVRRRPRVGLLATGDELIAPGDEPVAAAVREDSRQPGQAVSGSSQVFPSNVATMAAWCTHYGLATSEAVIGDDAAVLRATLLRMLEANDVVLTSGGAWTSERDLVASILDELGWRKIYHRVRMGPGKGVGFGLWHGKPVFILPGGPASNQMAFLQLALPGLHRLMGHPHPGLPVRSARLAAPARGQGDWTEFVEGRFSWDGPVLCITPGKGRSRLRSMAACEGYIKVPEGVETLAAGTVVPVQVLPDVPALHGEPAHPEPNAAGPDSRHPERRAEGPDSRHPERRAEGPDSRHPERRAEGPESRHPERRAEGPESRHPERRAEGPESKEPGATEPAHPSAASALRAASAQDAPTTLRFAQDASTAPLPLIVSFVAWSGTGKTTFLERLLPELKALGLKVGVLKHHAHATTFDVPGKDTYRMAAAGADVVAGVGAAQTAVFIPGDASGDIEGVIRHYLGDMDLVITEGYKRGRYPKIEVYRAEWAAADGRDTGLLCRPDELLALVSDVTFPLPAAVPQFGLEESRAVAQFLAGLSAARP